MVPTKPFLLKASQNFAARSSGPGWRFPPANSGARKFRLLDQVPVYKRYQQEYIDLGRRSAHEIQLSAPTLSDLGVLHCLISRRAAGVPPQSSNR